MELSVFSCLFVYWFWLRRQDLRHCTYWTDSIISLCRVCAYLESVFVGAAHTQCKHNWILSKCRAIFRSSRIRWVNHFGFDKVRMRARAHVKHWPEPAIKVRQMTSLHSSESVCCSFSAARNVMRCQFTLVCLMTVFAHAIEHTSQAITCDVVFTCTQNYTYPIEWSLTGQRTSMDIAHSSSCKYNADERWWYGSIYTRFFREKCYSRISKRFSLSVFLHIFFSKHIFVFTFGIGMQST